MARGRTGSAWWPALVLARASAAAAGTRTVGTQHVLLALLATDGDAAAVLRRAGVDRATVQAALQGITGVGARPGVIPVERVSVSPRVGALIRRASQGTLGEISDLAVLGALLDDGGEPSVVQLALTSLGARRRVLNAYGSATAATAVAPTRIGHSDGDLVAG
ncbi:Clp protease N-terminal domain-containing protein [Actinomycetospora endophytica]|uniref:Clp protease N-terminal domain-containing protein n=1 Tax=Actinomycetospora endophytica TaxID=2291215 RepID=A0ABS8PDH8_9PSEU|nr:Clp protease N-terminal domain-containing protein [Actinomycetospora endophytica]MCD2196293.1 Clp protease N-terminal domain-containing protein [Actinomycetospora endophytica]